jgi:hypothetical protein
MCRASCHPTELLEQRESGRARAAGSFAYNHSIAASSSALLASSPPTSIARADPSGVTSTRLRVQIVSAIVSHSSSRSHDGTANGGLASSAACSRVAACSEEI